MLKFLLEVITMNTHVKRFEFLDHTADVLIRAYGSTLEEAFANAALAVFEVITDTSRVEPRKSVDVEIEAEDLEQLLYRWIDELIFYHDSEGLVFSRFEVKIVRENSSYKLTGRAWGEVFDPSRHEHRTVVKAMTYAQMEIGKVDNVNYVQFVVDI